MNETAQTQERGQDALKKYPGLMHSIVVDDGTTISGLVLKNRTFQKLAYILSGDSFGISDIHASKIEHKSSLGWDIRRKTSTFIVPDKEVIMYFEIPSDYAEQHGQPDTGIPAPGNCNEYDVTAKPTQEEPHHPDCPATDGFGCRCDGYQLEERPEP